MIQINEIILKRRSYRSFKKEAVSDEIIISLIEAARWSPSSNNIQPWSYIIAKQNDEYFEKIIEAMYPSNQAWTKNAPLLVASFTQSFLEKDKRYRHISWMDTGGANANMTIQAISLGLFVHQIGGFDESVLRRNLGINETLDCTAILAIGYQGNGSDLTSPTFIERENSDRERISLNQLILNK
jgi:nitroreductase